MRIKTRFAPSPTGYLHIGGARTALFSYLYAKHFGGDFFLRIEDTDRTRYVEDAVDDIIRSLRWLGLDFDGEIVYQSKRLELYQKAASKLLEEGKAYRCFCSQARLERIRNVRMQNKLPSGYDRKCRDLSQDEINENMKNGVPYVIRLKVPLEGKTVCNDMIRGEIEFENSVLEDIVLLKSDGFPTYHLAHVVDDHDMEITHITRGEEWISSFPLHVILFNYMGYELPQYAHLPVILSADGGKLSKRHGATSVKEFIEAGYIPEAMINFLALLGWSYDDKQEVFSKDELIKYFDLSKVSKSSAVFSYEKLNWYNGYYLRNKSDQEYFKISLPFFIKAGYVKSIDRNIKIDLSEKNNFENMITKEEKDYIMKIIPNIKERIEILSQIESYCDFFYKDPTTYNIEDFIDKKRDINQNIIILEHVLEALSFLDEKSYNLTGLENCLRELAEKYNIRTKDLFMPIRIALTGRKYSPGLFETIEILGKETTLRRINNSINYLKSKL
ncbi:MAG: glutamate--tRNA ligase [Spirochaetes bacterium]|nr:glutamate--tRNA ligase [Spirochaetota bacterium]